MLRFSKLIFVFSLLALVQFCFGQQTPTGHAKDFKVKTCLHSVSYAGVWRGQAKLSVDGIMIVAKRPHLSPFDYDDAARKKLRQKIENLGLELVCLAGYTDFTAGVDKPGIPNVEIQASYVGEVAKLAHDLGTNMVRIFTGYEREGVAFDKQYSMVVEGLKLSGEKAAEWGVTLAVQNHHDIALHHDAMKWLLDEVNMPNVKSGWDAWSPTLEGLSSEEIRQSILTMKPHIVHTIAADYVRLPRFRYEHELTNYMAEEDVLRAVPIGKGIIDYEMFFNTLKEIGYQGYLAYEMCEVLDGGGSIENLDKTAKEFLDYVKKFE